MKPEVFLYTFICGAVVYGAFCAFLKERNFSLLFSSIIGALIVVFLSQDSKSAKPPDLEVIVINVSLVLYKAAYWVSWVLGGGSVRIFCGRKT